MNLKTLGASAVLVLTVTACGSDGATSVPGASSAPLGGASAAPASAAPAGSAAATGSGLAAGATPITERDFKFDTPNVTVSGAVNLAVTNAGPTVHNVTIRDASGKVLGATADLEPGASATLSVDIPAGAYTFFCSLPGHESLGLKGILTVTK